MIIIVKERGDISEKMGILKISEDMKSVEIVDHPELSEGDVHHISKLKHLITSMKRD